MQMAGEQLADVFDQRARAVGHVGHVGHVGLHTFVFSNGAAGLTFAARALAGTGAHVDERP